MQTLSQAMPSVAEHIIGIRRHDDHPAVESDAESQARLLHLAALGEMTAAMAHEGRGALQLAEANLDLLAEEITAQPAALARLQRVRKAQQCLRRLFEDIRQITAPIGLAPEWCDLEQLALQTAQELSLSCGGKTLVVETSGSAALRRCWVDPSRMAQVLRNLFENSLAACTPPARISLQFATAMLDGGGAVRLAIRDNGPGLSEEQRGRLFTPFYTTKHHGTGLGLSIARRIVERHGGEMRLGDDLGAGAEFVITLPRRANRRARRAIAARRNEQAAPARDSDLDQQVTRSEVALAPGTA